MAEIKEAKSQIVIDKQIFPQAFWEALKTISSSLDREEIIEHCLEYVPQLVKNKITIVSILDRKKNQLNCNTYTDRRQKFTLPLGEGICAWSASNLTPLLSDNVRADNRLEKKQIETTEREIGFPVTSVLSVPLVYKGKFWGTVEAINKIGGGSFEKSDLKILSVLSDFVAIALENFSLYQKSQRSNWEKEVLLEVGKTLSSTLNLNEVLDLILMSVFKVVGCDAAGIFLVNQEKQEVETMRVRGYDLALEADMNLKVGQGLIGWVAKTGEPVIVPDVRQDSRYVNARQETLSEVVAPISYSGKVIGVFNLESNRLNNYDQEDLELLTTYASHAAIAVERARLYQETLEKRKLEEELNIARQIQLSFLPPSNPQINGFDIAGINIPSAQVGGDYYDFIQIVDNQLGIAIGDVSGKGIPAALIMASFRASLKAEIRNNYAIRTIFSKVNLLLYESVERENFVTAVYGVLDLKNKIFTFSNAGHNPPILRRKKGQIEYLSEGGLALAMFPDSKYEERPISLNSGDLILLYTDGVSEALNEKKDEFGTDRLVQIIKQHHSLKAGEILQKIYEEVLSFSAGNQRDDLTMVAVKIL